MRVFIIRHGLSASNLAGLVTGTPADELVDTGRAQALALGQWLRESGVQPDAFFVSHWGRARQTAQLAMPNVDWQEDSRLGETDAGEDAQLQRAAFLTRWPEFYDNPSNTYPGGESHLDLNQRVLSFWRELSECGLASVMLVTHSGPISCILQNVMGIGMDKFPAFLPVQASVSVVESCGVGADGEMQYQLKSFAIGPLANIGQELVG